MTKYNLLAIFTIVLSIFTISSQSQNISEVLNNTPCFGSVNKNKEVYQRIQNSHCVEIISLYWLATHNITDEEIIMEDADWARMFPEIYRDNNFKYKPISEVLNEYNKYGFFAIVGISEAINFNKNNGTLQYDLIPKKRVKYIYAETIEELLKNIEQEAELFYQYDYSTH